VHSLKLGFHLLSVAALFSGLLAEEPVPTLHSTADQQSNLLQVQTGAADTNSSFIRFVRSGKDGGKVETAVRTFRSNNVEVVLFAAVHVGDRKYYQDLQRRFTDFDALLYEMIRYEEDAPSTPEEMSDNPISRLQIGMKRLLNLDFQLEAVDYSPPNFVHADLDPDSFFELQRERRESILGLMIRLMLEEHARLQAGKGSTVDGFQLLFALMDPDRAHALKLLFGRQMGELEAMLAGFEENSGEQGSVIVGARNARALDVLQREIGNGRHRFGIFYGAAHMPDFERRLKLMGYELKGEEWLTAWDIQRKKRSETGRASE
jgi:hypothetical protein